jgi:hypothetical protein
MDELLVEAERIMRCGGGAGCAMACADEGATAVAT